MATSTIPAFKAALFARLVADATVVADGIAVSYGLPYPSPPSPETIYLGGTRSTGESPGALGVFRRDERYNVMLMCWKRADQRTPQQTITERAFAIAAIVEASIRTWGGPGVVDSFSFSTTGVLMAGVTSLDHDEDVASDGRFSVVHITVSVQARI
jgi:hypothetical protein